MKIDFINSEDINKPGVNILFACILGTLTYNLIDISLCGAVLITASFFFIHLLIYGKKFLVIVLLFFITSYFNNVIYYFFDNYNKEMCTVEVSDSKGKIVQVGRQNFKVEGKDIALKDGAKYLIYGEFIKSKDVEKGIVGSIRIEKYRFLSYGISGISNLMQDKFYNKISKYIGNDEAALVSSAAFGYTKYLKNQQNQEMNKFGIIHVVSVSGFHIAVIYSIIEKLFGFKIALLLSFIYTIFSGGKSSTLRAFMMIFALKMSKKVYRNYDPISALCFSGILLICFKPYYILDLGFELSYISTLGILLFYNKLKRHFYKIPEILNDPFCISISAQVFSFPIATLALNNFSPNFLWGNLFLLPIFTIMVVLGNIAFLFLWNDMIFKLIAMLVKNTMIALQGGISLIDKVSLKVTNINPKVVYGYCLLLVCFYFYNRGYKKAKIAIFGVLIGLILSLYSFPTKITYVHEDNISGVLVQQGFKRVFITPNITDYYSSVANKKYYPTEILKWRDEEQYNMDGIIVMPNAKKKEIDIINKPKAYILFGNEQCYISNEYYDIIKFNGERGYINNKKSVFSAEGDNSD